ncbi:Nitronate monooxygenase [Geobacillus sp. BCO2]|nr:Nitronate monooxygenase [Geobacillus sp. BCO2]
MQKEVIAMFSTLPIPIIQAPMAGGVSTPALAAAVSNAGGLGFLAGGYKTAEAMKKEIHELRTLTDRPFGVNVFVPGDKTVDEEAVERYRVALAAEAERLGRQSASRNGRTTTGRRSLMCFFRSECRL